MTGKYTPGPWVLTGTAGIAVGTTEQESAVAVCVYQGTRTAGEAQANARLIAAAPDLLEALRSADQFIANGVELGYISMPEADTRDTAHDTLPTIRAAIAKAEGRV